MEHGQGATCSGSLFAKDDQLGAALARHSHPTVQFIYETPDGIRTATLVSCSWFNVGMRAYSLRPLNVLSNGMSPGDSVKPDAQLSAALEDLAAANVACGLLKQDLSHQTQVATRLAHEHEEMTKTLTAAQQTGKEHVERIRALEKQLTDAADRIERYRREVEAELKAESAKVGELQTEVDELKQERSGLVKRLHDVGVGVAFNSLGRITGTTRAPSEPPIMVYVADIPPGKNPKDLLNEVATIVEQGPKDAPVINGKPQEFKTLLIGAQPQPQIVPAIGHAKGRLRRTITIEHSDPAWNGLYRKVEKPEPDTCPLPKKVSGWKSTFRGQSSEDRSLVDPFGTEWVLRANAAAEEWKVFRSGNVVARGECLTVEDGLKQAVTAARQVWRVRNGKKVSNG
jgi:hypothetical protein